MGLITGDLLTSRVGFHRGGRNHRRAAARCPPVQGWVERRGPALGGRASLIGETTAAVNKCGSGSPTSTGKCGGSRSPHRGHRDLSAGRPRRVHALEQRRLRSRPEELQRVPGRNSRLPLASSGLRMRGRRTAHRRNRGDRLAAALAHKPACGRPSAGRRPRARRRAGRVDVRTAEGGTSLPARAPGLGSGGADGPRRRGAGSGRLWNGPGGLSANACVKAGVQVELTICKLVLQRLHDRRPGPPRPRRPATRRERHDAIRRLAVRTSRRPLSPGGCSPARDARSDPAYPASEPLRRVGCSRRDGLLGGADGAATPVDRDLGPGGQV